MKMMKVFTVLPYLYQMVRKLCGQKKRMVSLLIYVAMICAHMSVIHVAKAENADMAVLAEVPVIADGQVLVNGTKAAQIGAVTYSVSEEGYEIDASSARVRVGNGDSLAFSGMISAPEGQTISWIRVDVYDATTEEPYTVGAEYYRDDDVQVQQYDLANIPAMTIGEAFGRKDYVLAEGEKYIVMFCVGDSNGNGFADLDTDVEEDQGPAVLVDVKLSPENCKHLHSDYVYVLHSSGEIRKQSYGDGLTHQVEPLYERYCGLCDSFLMNIWGGGIAEEHTLDSNGVCSMCGYSGGMMGAEVSAYVNTNSVNLRAGASRDSGIIAKLEKGMLVQVRGSEVGRGGKLWYKISCEAGTGYVMAELLTDSDEAQPEEPDEITEPTEPTEANAEEGADIPNIDQTNPERRVTINADWGEGELHLGDTVTMSMQLSGYEGLEYSVFWQCDKGAGFETVAELDGEESFSVIVNRDNAGWIWRAGVNARAVRTEAAMTEAEENNVTTTDAIGEAEGGNNAAE